MTVKDQLNTLKDNWLIIAAIFVLLLFLSGGGSILNFSQISAYDSMEMAYAPSAGAYYRGGYYGEDFAPEVEERVIIKTSSLQTEVKRGEFDEAASKISSIISSSDSIPLSQNVNEYGDGWRRYKVGSYTIKVPTDKYDAVVAQLKDIGEVKSFNENAQDVTGTYTNLNTELEVEKARLERYQAMYDEAETIEDKINLNDRIFQQERTIKYLEESIEKIDQKVDYTQVSVSLTEKRSEYIDVSLAKFSDLVKSLVNSFNALLYLAFIILPWLAAFAVVRFVYNRLKKK